MGKQDLSADDYLPEDQDPAVIDENSRSPEPWHKRGSLRHMSSNDRLQAAATSSRFMRNVSSNSALSVLQGKLYPQGPEDDTRV
ncbi:hypothetical protein LshimejAT787_0704920 [Lyophyllum shimeji]|uniref:Uncharacterized protein n=1 Tax=Lyophyllum shimeji TaxID=47721 RepID=A0A9P3PP11_LYOSH|nr:hypothetical protein LshimejAT787_0704920 [Lyophyllum shimeji]